MNRRTFHVSAVALLAALIRADTARAQPPSPVRRIGYLSSGSQLSSGVYLEEFKKSMESLGYLDGKDIVIDVRWADGTYERLPGLARQLVALRPDVIVASTTPAIQAAKQATATIPIVMSNVADPVRSGFVESLARPGRNITGVTHMSDDLVSKCVELLHAIVPKAKRIAVLMRSGNPAFDRYLERIRQAAAGLGVTVLPTIANSPQELETAFAAIKKAGAGGLIVLTNPMIMGQRRQIAELAAEANLPAIYQFREHAEAGGLLSFGSNLPRVNRQAAAYVDKILKGAKPRDLPVQQPTEMELVVNLKAAKALGITIPPEILHRADSLIE